MSSWRSPVWYLVPYLVQYKYKYIPGTGTVMYIPLYSVQGWYWYMQNIQAPLQGTFYDRSES